MSASGMYPPFTPIFHYDTNTTYNFSWIDSLAPCPPSTAWRPATTVDTFQTFQLSVDVVLVSVLCLFGFIGNALTIITLRDDVKNKKNTTNWLLQVLAVLDIIYLSACVYKPYKVLRDVTAQPRSRVQGHHVTFTHAMLYVELAARGVASISQTAIVWVVVMVTIDRYLAVCRPMVGAGLRTLRCVRRTVFVVVVAALLYNIPIFFENKVRTTQDRCSGHQMSRLASTSLRTDRVYFLVYRTILYVIFRSVGPLFIIIVVNVSLAAALSVVRRRRRRLLSTGARRARDNRSNMTLMLIVVVSMFVVCELPDVGLRLAVTIYEFESTVRLHLDAVRYAHVAANALHVVNASVNFIIYCLVGRKFRRLLGRRLVGCRPPTITVSEEVAEDWGAGTPAGEGGSDCENVAMVSPVMGREGHVSASAVGGAVDQCVIVVHQPQYMNTSALTSPAMTATSD